MHWPPGLFIGWAFNAVRVERLYLLNFSGSISDSNKHHSRPFTRILFTPAFPSNAPEVKWYLLQDMS